MGFSVLGFSVPVFVIGYVLIYVFAIELGWLPVQGYSRWREGLSGLSRAAGPAELTLSVIYIALIARITRTSVLEVLGEDYIRTARAKGLTDVKVLMRHALRNAAVPIVTVIGIGIALLIGGVVVTESVFNIPGPRPADRRRGAGARLPDHPGGDPAVLVRLRADQPRRRPALHAARSEDPLLSAMDAQISTCRVVPTQPRRPRRGMRTLPSRNPSVVDRRRDPRADPADGRWPRRCSAPIDPAQINPVYRNKTPGTKAIMRRDDGTKTTFTHWMGTEGSAATSTAAWSTARASRCWSASRWR